MTTVLVLAGGALVLFVLVVLAGNRVLRSGGATSGGMADGLGSFIDVFDPARARADQDLKSHQNQGAVIPNLEDDEPPVVVDLVKKVARIRLR